MVLFNTLWTNHPSNQIPEITSPCLNKGGQPSFANQCSIRMGVTLAASGISTKTFKGATCWHGHGRTHLLRVEELAKWLEKNPKLLGKVVKHKKVTYSDFTGKKGVVMFRNFWGTNNQGDHIDLWNGYKMAHGSNDYFERSQEVWFWELS
jgi:hypothetical protein